MHKDIKIIICPTCHKSVIKHNNRQIYCSKYCKDKNRYKKYHQEHQKEIKKYKKLYNEKNKEKIKRYRKMYRKKHIKEIREYTRKYYKNPLHRLMKQLRSRIGLSLKGNPKLSTTMELVGCSIRQLKKHLEKQFKSGMSWKNHAFDGWHIDHIIPCSKFDLSKKSEQKKCFHYTNLQPLWAEDNFQKHNKLLK